MKLEIKTQLMRWYPVILVVALVLLIVLVIYPVVSSILSLNDQIQEERVDLEKKYIRGQLLKQTQDDLLGIEKEIDRVHGITLKSGNELDLIQTLERIAQLHNMKQEISMDGLPEHFDKTIALPTRIELEGTFDELLGYLIELESLSFYVNIDGINISSGAADSKNRGVVARQVPSSPDETPVTTIDPKQVLHITLSAETFWKPNSENLKETPQAKEK